DPDLDFHDAFMHAVAEYNAYGSAAQNCKWKIDDSTAGQMYGFKADLGDQLFDPDALAKARKRAIDGRDHVKAQPASQQFATVDEKLDVLTKGSHKMSFDQDCLKLTRDVAQLGHGTLETWVPYVFGQVPQFINDLAEHNEWAANIV
ncbi:Uncharacterized protein SCF082_LOCUS17699, partial [Durusdinium trenchii]